MNQFFDYRSLEKPAPNRVFCGHCFKPCRMENDDLSDVLAASDYCRCNRRSRDAT